MAKLRLDELLEKRGRTLYWLAKETGINHTSLFRLRHNQAREIKFDVIDKLCAALECTPSDLIELESPKTAAPSAKGKN